MGLVIHFYILRRKAKRMGRGNSTKTLRSDDDVMIPGGNYDRPVFGAEMGAKG